VSLLAPDRVGTGLDPSEKGDVNEPGTKADGDGPDAGGPTANGSVDEFGLFGSARGGLDVVGIGSSVRARSITGGFAVASVDWFPELMTWPEARGELRSGFVVALPNRVGFSGAVSDDGTLAGAS
jgi:hypothetical protein